MKIEFNKNVIKILYVIIKKEF